MGVFQKVHICGKGERGEGCGARIGPAQTGFTRNGEGHRRWEPGPNDPGFYFLTVKAVGDLCGPTPYHPGCFVNSSNYKPDTLEGASPAVL